MPQPPLIIAIDGPSGSGKSSVSRAVAQELGLGYLDSGAMYRAAAWYMIDIGADMDDARQIAGNIDNFEMTVVADAASPDILVDGVSVEREIRGPDVTAAVSRVSAVPEVRTALVQQQRDVVAAAPKGIVVEGRDIGTVVLPNAALKVFLVADQEARAQRRAAQDAQEGRSGDVSATAASLAARDAADSSRRASPLMRADDAIEVDATFLTLPEVIDTVLALARDRDC